MKKQNKTNHPCIYEKQKSMINWERKYFGRGENPVWHLYFTFTICKEIIIFKKCNRDNEFIKSQEKFNHK